MQAPKYVVEAIGFVKGGRKDVSDDFWGDSESVIEFRTEGPEPIITPAALDGLVEQFSHVEIVFLFDRVSEAKIERGARHPRGNEAWPSVGILAQRAKARPNRIGCTICRLVRREGANILVVRGLDAVDGTPVLDIKPIMKEFMPQQNEKILQPSWASELMQDYWKAKQ